MKKLIILLFFIGHILNYHAQHTNSRTYREFNTGVALLNKYSITELGGVLIGLSYVSGKQHYFSEKYFFEYQMGLALPSIVTGKLGVGATGKIFGGSIGIRVLPTFLYGQLHFRFEKSQLNFSAEVSPFYNYNSGNEISPSFGANAIFTCGYQWPIDESKIRWGKWLRNRGNLK